MAAERAAWENVQASLPGSPHFDHEAWQQWCEAVRRADLARNAVAEGARRWGSQRDAPALPRSAVAPHPRPLLRAGQGRTRLRDELAKRDQFFSIVVHELRNCMGPVMLALTMLDRSPKLDIARDLLRRQLRKMQRHIDDLADISRIANGKFTVEPQPVVLQEIVSAVIQESQSALAQGGHRLELNMPRKPLLVCVDRVRIGQVLTNVVVNAIKFTPAGGLISIGAAARHGLAEVRITDTGRGIERARLKDVFELFTQLEHRPAAGGLGIGLAIAKLLMEMHSGTIHATSPGVGKGATFVIRLPLVSAQGHALLQ